MAPFQVPRPQGLSNGVNVRRRPTRQQGRGLEMLAHAIEYLADSELYSGREAFSPDVVEAMQILMERSRSLFAECAEIVPVRKGVRQALIRMFGRPPLVLPPVSASSFRADTLAR